MQKVYCDISFWNKFSETFPASVSPIDSLISKMKCYLNIFEFISRSEIVLLNISVQEVEKKVEEDQWLQMLWISSTEGVCKLDFDTSHNIDKITENLNSIFLLGANNQQLKQNCDNNGIMSISISEIEDCTYLFSDQGAVIDMNERSRFDGICWKILNKAKHICSSMIIIDPYILSDTDMYDANIKIILDKLIPISLNSEFHITIVTQSSNRNKTIDLNERFEIINMYIKKIRPNLKYMLNIYDDNRFHDRLILTNHIMIKCGAGFSLYKRVNGEYRAGNSSDVSIVYPNLQNSIAYAVELYNKNLKLVRRSFDDTISQNGRATQYGRNVKNRLL